MMVIPYDGPVYIGVDNQSVPANTTIPDSMLKQKFQSIAYYMLREGRVRDDWILAYVNTHNNDTDLLTK